MENKQVEEAKYNNEIVRIGNWNEEKFLKEDKIRQFLEKRNHGKLLVQKTRKLFCNLLREIEIEAPCQYIRFGAIVQLIACDMPEFPCSVKLPLALSIVANEKSIHLSQHISDKCDVTVAPTETPCVRNTFIIKSADKTDRTNELLKYGQDFYLRCVDGETAPLVLYSSPKTMGLLNISNCPHAYYNEFGEENQSVGICLQADHQCGYTDCLPFIPPTHCRWKAMHVVGIWRIETEGEPVPANARLIIINSNSNRNLAAEKVWTKTFFGPELGVSATTYKDIYRREEPQNIWMLSTRIKE